MASYRIARCLLQSVLDRKKMSQQELADRVGWTRQQVNNYASGRTTMSLTSALIVSKVLNCHVEDLYELVPVNK